MTYGLIGEKLVHSYSKLIHESLGRYSYELISLTKEAFGPFLCDRSFKGLNVTIPYKKAVIPYCDRVTDLAREIGAVNTLYFRDGLLHGTNTDYEGFLYAARRAGISFDRKKVLILGNGGTSLMARKAAADSGAAEILIASRRCEEGCIFYEALKDHKDIEIIINTTPVGTYPDNGSSLINLSDFPQCCGVIDVIYNPLATNLLQQAETQDIPHSNGLPMLVAQATAAAEYFLDETGFREENERIIRELRQEIENLVLIGGTEDEARKTAEKQNKVYAPLTDLSLAEDLGKEKGLLIHVAQSISCSSRHIRILTQNGRIL